MASAMADAPPDGDDESSDVVSSSIAIATSDKELPTACRCIRRVLCEIWTAIGWGDWAVLKRSVQNPDQANVFG